MLSRVLTVLSLLGLVACTNANDLNKAPVPLGDFSLGHNVVVAPNLVKGPVSRDASVEDWQGAVKSAVAERFGRYKGKALYHFGISVEGYVLAQPGVPVVASPKSVLILRLTVWDDALGQKLNSEPEQFTVLETFSGETFIGSGLTQSKEIQMQNLSRNAAKQIERFLVKKHAEEGWFSAQAGEQPVPQEESASDPAN